MSIFDQELILPGTITEIMSDYASDYDTSQFGSTDSVVIVGTAFNGPIGKPIAVYSPEHASYIFGSSFDYSTRREATLVSEIQDAWDKGCRTIYAVRIGGKDMYKDYEFATGTTYKLRVSAIYPYNGNKEICFWYDDASSAADIASGKEPAIKIYKPADRATIEEKMLGKVPNSDAILVNTIDLGYSSEMTDSTRMVDFISFFNSYKNNNVVRLSIINEEGAEVTDTPEAQSIAFGDMFPGLYTIGRDTNNPAIILKTEVDTQYVPEHKRSEIYETFSGSLFKTLKVNTNVKSTYPIYHYDVNEMNRLITGVADVAMSKMFDFLEITGKIDFLWKKDKIDYEEVILSNFETYKRLGSGFANTAKIVETKSGSNVYKVVEVTDDLDAQKIMGIDDGIYSILQNVSADYRVVAGIGADTSARGELPKKEAFLAANPLQNEAWSGMLRTMTKLKEGDLSAVAKKYYFDLATVYEYEEAFDPEALMENTYMVNNNYIVNKFAVLLDDKYKSVSDAAKKEYKIEVAGGEFDPSKHAFEEGQFVLVESGDASSVGEYHIYKFIDGKLRSLYEKSMFEDVFTSGMLVLTCDEMFKPEHKLDVNGLSCLYFVPKVTLVNGERKSYYLVSILGKTYVARITDETNTEANTAHPSGPRDPITKARYDYLKRQGITWECSDFLPAIPQEVSKVEIYAELQDILDGSSTMFTSVVPVWDATNELHKNVIVRVVNLDATLFSELIADMNADEKLSRLFTFTAKADSLAYDYVICEDGLTGSNDSRYIYEHPGYAVDLVDTNRVKSGSGLTAGNAVIEDRAKPKFDGAKRIAYSTKDNFARQLAQHCIYTSLKTYPTHGVIGCSKMFSPSIKALEERVDVLVNKDYDMNAKKGNGNNMLDRDNTPYNIGRAISVIFTQHTVATGNNYTYITNGASAYAGMVSALPIDQSSTAQPFSSQAPIFELTNFQLGRLTQAGYVTIKNSYTKGYVVTDGVTMAPYNSAFRRLSVARIMGGVEEAIRNAADPYIGKQNHLANRNSLQAAIRSSLDKMLDTLIARYDFKVATDKSAERMGIIEIDYTLVPIYEIREVRNKISVTSE